jgi:hypothetical protein
VLSGGVITLEAIRLVVEADAAVKDKAEMEENYFNDSSDELHSKRNSSGDNSNRLQRA